MQRLVQFESIASVDHTTDVLVVGFGGAGASAALEARRAGSAVTVLERASGGGGSTMMSACEMYLGGSGGTALQRDLGFEDSTDNFRNYLLASFGDYSDPARVEMFVHGAAEHFDWAESLGVRYKRAYFAGRDVVAMTGDSLQYTGNERAWPFNQASTPIPRGHLPADADHNGGQVFMGTLLQRVEEAGATILADTRALQLIQDAQGRIRGVVAKRDGRMQTLLARQGVILTAGGFVMNETMTRKYLPHLDAICTRHGNPGDQGDGILMGMAAGGNVLNMEQAFVGVAHYPPPQLTYGIFVNKQGQRFINEDIYLGRLGHFATQQEDGAIYMFIDNRHFERPAYLQTEIVAVGETVAEVEADAGLPEGSLTHTVAYYNEHAARGEDPLFHKSPEWLE
ncbi:MAG TPA: FAD-dependent oxidoreductase, partial [Spongiibacteraceae bacterium]|nr:FAD-dependent oxidoreductase [Spongiibacteraceae bacterium]